MNKYHKWEDIMLSDPNAQYWLSTINIKVYCVFNRSLETFCSVYYCMQYTHAIWMTHAHRWRRKKQSIFLSWCDQIMITLFWNCGRTNSTRGVTLLIKLLQKSFHLKNVRLQHLNSCILQFNSTRDLICPLDVRKRKHGKPHKLMWFLHSSFLIFSEHKISFTKHIYTCVLGGIRTRVRMAQPPFQDS